LRVLANPKPKELSASLQIEEAFLETLQQKSREQGAELSIETLDCYVDDVPQLDDGTLAVSFRSAPLEEATAETKRKLARREAILQQFISADLVIIAAPMWNFGPTPMLKAWIDTVVIRGRTFDYGASGPEGLMKGKKVVLCVANGGDYQEGSTRDFYVPWLKVILGFVGITDLILIRAQQQAYGPAPARAQVEAAIAEAKAAAPRFVPGAVVVSSV